jgi:hypothetical protein
MAINSTFYSLVILGECSQASLGVERDLSSYRVVIYNNNEYLVCYDEHFTI